MKPKRHPVKCDPADNESIQDLTRDSDGSDSLPQTSSQHGNTKSNSGKGKLKIDQAGAGKSTSKGGKGKNSLASTDDTAIASINVSVSASNRIELLVRSYVVNWPGLVAVHKGSVPKALGAVYGGKM
jgi:hypothetical protein